MENNETAEWLQSEANNGWTSGYSHITGAGGRKSIGEYPTYEEYLNVHNNETAYVNKLRRPANIKSTAVNIVVAVLIFAPALVGIFYVGSHIFNSITGGNNEPNPQVTTSAPVNTHTEKQAPTLKKPTHQMHVDFNKGDGWAFNTFLYEESNLYRFKDTNPAEYLATLGAVTATFITNDIAVVTGTGYDSRDPQPLIVLTTTTPTGQNLAGYSYTIDTVKPGGEWEPATVTFKA